ncbi:MAG: M1 family metallopeptidase, partial [Myxococcota bacterium]
ESWLTPPVFRDAVRGYLASHADGAVTTADFIRAVSAATGRDIGPVIASFLDHPGIPEVAVDLSCTAGRAAVQLRQRRHRLRPHQSSDDRSFHWHIPMCLRYPDTAAGGRKSLTQCTVLDRPEARLELPGAGCPTWVMPNADAAGYYRYRVDRDQLAALVRAPLSTRERVDLSHNLRGWLLGGQLPIGDGLDALGALGRGRDRHLVQATMAILKDVVEHLAGPADRAAVGALVRRLLGARARAVGLVPRRVESENDTLLRPVLVGFVGRYGAPPALVRPATRLTETWLKSGSGIEPGVIAATLGIAAFHGDARLYDRFVAALRAAHQIGDKTRVALLVAALGEFRQPALIARNLELLGQFDHAVRMELVRALMFNPAARAPTVAHLQRVWSQLTGRDVLLLLAPLYVGIACDRAEMDAITALAGRVSRVRELIAPQLRLARYRSALCTDYRTVQSDGVRAFLRR